MFTIQIFRKKTATSILSEMVSATMPSLPSTAELRDRYAREMPQPTGLSAQGIRPVIPAPTLTVGNEIDIAAILNSDSPGGVAPPLGKWQAQSAPLTAAAVVSGAPSSTGSKKFGEMSKNSSFVRDLLEPSTPGGVVGLKVSEMSAT